MRAFAAQVLTTPQGWTLIVLGNLVGFMFAVVAFTLSVVSFPLLLDRDAGIAVVTPLLGHATWHLYRKVVA